MASATKIDELFNFLPLPSTGVLVCDERGTIVFASDGVESALGYDPADVEGSAVDVLFPDPSLDPLSRLREGAGGVSIESLVGADGSRRRIAVGVTTTRSDGGVHLTLSLQPLGAGGPCDSTATVTAPLTSFAAAAFWQAGIPLAVLDGDLRFVAANDAAVEMYGYDSRSALVGDRLDALFETTDRSRIRTEILPGVRHYGRWEGEVRAECPDGSTRWQELSLTAIDAGGYVLVGSEPTGSDGTARTALGLLETAGRLVRTSDAEELTRHALDALVGSLGYEVGCIRLFDPDRGTLEPTALTGRAEQLVASRPAFDLDGTNAGRAYRRGELVSGRCDGLSDADTDEEWTLHVPVGDQGTVTLFSAASDGFTPAERSLVESFATALAAHVRSVRERSERRDRLAQLEATVAFTRHVVETLAAVGDVTTHETPAEMVCERLTASEYVDGVWFAENALVDAGVTVRARCGVDTPSVHLIETLSESGVGCEDLQRTLESGTVTIADERIDLGGDGAPSPVALVPVAIRTRVYGVFGIRLSEPVACEGIVEPALAALGKAVGSTRQTAKARALLRADRVVELEFDFSEADSPLVDVAAALDCRFKLEPGMVDETTDTDGVCCYFRVEGVGVATALDALLDRPDVRDASAVRTMDDGGLIEVVQTDSDPLVQFLRDVGVTVRTVTVTGESGQLVVQVPQSADIRRLVSTYQSQHPGVTLVAKRERERGTAWPAGQWTGLEDRLTEKQRVALETAVEEGYYEWPRESTAEEVAESMGISSATLHQHLRRGEQEILSAFLDVTD